MNKNKTNNLVEQNKKPNGKVETLRKKKKHHRNRKAKKKNEYYMFEELKYEQTRIKEVCLFAWFYFFENMKLKLDHFLSSYLNYAFFLAKNVDANKRKILLIEYPFSLHNEPVDIDEKFTFVLNNTYYESIERIVHADSKHGGKRRNSTETTECEENRSNIDELKERENNEMNDEQLNIINFLKKKKIKNMIYMSDIFATDQMAIMFVVDSEDKGGRENKRESELVKNEDMEYVGTNPELTQWKKNKGETAESDNVMHKGKLKGMDLGTQKKTHPLNEKKERKIEENIQDEDRDENGILKGYDIIILRNSYEILYFYKELSGERVDNTGEKETDMLLFGDHYKIKNNEHHGGKTDKQVQGPKKNGNVWKENVNNKKEVAQLEDYKWDGIGIGQMDPVYNCRNDHINYDSHENTVNKEPSENSLMENWTRRTSFSDVNTNDNKQQKRKEKLNSKVFEWKKYLIDINAYKETVILDSLSICSGMDGYVENANENCDTLLNDDFFYLVKYDKKLSVYRLIHAVSSLLSTNFKPIAYIPFWWYHDTHKCASYLEEPPEFHRVVFNELQKDGLLFIGEKHSEGALIMDQNDVAHCVELAESNSAILCSNNNDIIDYYISMRENGRVSKFISHDSFFILANYL